MKTIRKLFLKLSCSALLLISTTVFYTNNASGYSPNDPFSLRFDAALSRYGNYADVLGVGGASTGSTFSSSTNPASTAVRKKEPGDFTISPQRTNIEFDNGHDLGLNILGGTYQINERQALEYGVADIKSSSDTRIGDPSNSTFKLEAKFYSIGWATTLGDRNQCDETPHSIGLSYNRQSNDSQLKLGSLEAVTDSGDSDSLSIGYLYHTKIGGHSGGSSCDKKVDRNDLALGVSLTFSDAESRRNSLVSSSGGSQSDNHRLRLGVGYRISEGRYIYSDFQYAKYNNTNQNGIEESIDVSRLYSGIQWQVPKKAGNGFRLYLRAGFVLDAEGNKSETLGIGTIVHKTDSFELGVDLALQQNMFPEIAPEFGDSDLVNLSVRLKFKN